MGNFGDIALDAQFAGVNNLAATVAPNPAVDDITLGYEVGSQWIDVTADKAYVCLDNTDGVAIWTQVNNGNLIVSFSKITSVDSPYTAEWGEDVSVDCTNGDVVVNMPTAVSNAGKTIWVTKSDASVNKVDIEGNATETINGDLTISINKQYVSRTLRSDATNLVIR